MSNNLRNWEDLDGVNRKFGSLYYFSKLMGNSSFVNGHEREHYDDQNIVNEVRQGKSRYQPTFMESMIKNQKRSNHTAITETVFQMSAWRTLFCWKTKKN